MQSFVLPALIVIVLAITLGVLARLWRGEGKRPAWPLYAKKVLTRPEQVLYYRLVRALPDHIVLAQVQLSRVLGVKRGFNFAQWNNRINRLSLDFLICLKDSTVVAAIELDDSSHNESRRREADARKALALDSAGIRLIRWSTNALPDHAAIRAAVEPQSATPVPDDSGSIEGRLEPQ